MLQTEPRHQELSHPLQTDPPTLHWSHRLVGYNKVPITMETILEKIKKISERAAEELREEGFISDTEIRTLDRQDLCELLPGKAQLKVRKEIFQLISQVPPQRNTKHSIDDINIRGLIPPDSFENAPSEQGPLLEYLQLLKDHRIYLIICYKLRRSTNTFFTPRGKFGCTTDLVCIKFVAKAAKTRRSTNESFTPRGKFGCTTDLVCIKFVAKAAKTRRSTNESFTPRGKFGCTTDLVCIKFVAKAAKTSSCHVQDGGHSESLQLQKTNDEDCQVIIVFCPVVSRAGTDVEAALREVCGDKPIILVAMHHMHSPSGLPPPRTNSKVVLESTHRFGLERPLG
uniref:SAM domain-containing protein n=1 Tax=Knipowitschia caucasica TaxID=637954 RepID=A0AAV2KB24_KNICA